MTIFIFKICYFFYGDIMKVILFDESHEKDLEEDINDFLENTENIEVLDIKYQVSTSLFSEEQIYCFSAMIIYKKI